MRFGVESTFLSKEIRAPLIFCLPFAFLLVAARYLSEVKARHESPLGFQVGGRFNPLTKDCQIVVLEDNANARAALIILTIVLIFCGYLGCSVGGMPISIATIPIQTHSRYGVRCINTLAYPI